ncbi:olfactory receptor 1G1 [Ailuropoda melanoleuca]|uniref:olfactory receptor 1G1 n=1 Tax=Ailuropoda melanoleuca TaxID=9646 RepID=UPI001494AB6B|nr:olfactory receptor 1G1 [Ailuropoda melanoleuca]
MKPRNHTVSVSEFLLLGLSEQQEQQPLLLGIFLSVYLVTVLGNIVIILAIVSDPHLHTPMYFFLANFSLTDLCLASTTIPRMLVNIQANRKTITYTGCLSQIYFFLWFIGLDVFLLAVMAYDRLVAICHPLHYTLVMTPRCCILLLVMSLILAQSYSLTHTILLAQLSFCTDNIIPHFFCELLPLLKLSCSNTYVNQCVLIYWGGALTILIPLLIIVSYVRIMAAIVRVPSASGKWKAFSTCSSHLSAVCLFYVSAIGVYFIPSSAESASKDRIAAVMYAVVTPMLNPFIYSLRNKDMKRSVLRWMMHKTTVTFYKMSASLVFSGPVTWNRLQHSSNIHSWLQEYLPDSSKGKQDLANTYHQSMKE